MIKQPLKRWFRNFLSLLTLQYFYPGFVIKGDLKLLFLAAIVLTLIQFLIHPLLKVLYLPVRIITLGMFNWLLVGIHLIILALLFDTIYFTGFAYKSFKVIGIAIPSGELNMIFSFILGSILYRLIRKIIVYLT